MSEQDSIETEQKVEDSKTFFIVSSILWIAWITATFLEYTRIALLLGISVVTLEIWNRRRKRPLQPDIDSGTGGSEDA